MAPGSAARLLAVLLAKASASELKSISPHHAAFASFIESFGRSYQPGSEEYEQRLALFSERATQVEKLNEKEGKLWTAGIGPFSDYTEEELKALRGWNGVASSTRGEGGAAGGAALSQVSALPDEFMNWTMLSSLEDVANQGHCGSCWAVSSSVVLNAHAEIYKSPQRSFAAQELVNCVPNPKSCGGTGGCKGATVELAMNYAMHMGLGSEGDVPYTAKAVACNLLDPGAPEEGSTPLALAHTDIDDDEDIDEDETDDEDEDGDEDEFEDEDDYEDAWIQAREDLRQLEKLHEKQDLETAGVRTASPDSAGLISFGMRGWEKLPENRYEPLMRAIYERGPVGVSVAAEAWHMYSKGVFDGCEKDAVIDHAVTLIGYGKDEETSAKFWTIQNSWGPRWGEGGRIRLLRRDTDETEQCGTDRQPEKGTACKGGPASVKVCGMCGILYDSVVPHFA